MAVLRELGLLSSESAVALEAEINKCAVDAMAFADASPMPDPASVLYDV
jgi:TPP-dependent pyruvate/acetoin dehydrogenase alpha subunit